MNVDNAVSAARQPASPVARILQPIRKRLIFAAVLAAVGAMLGLVPLAGMAEIARQTLGSADSRFSLWQIVMVSISCLVVGTALVFASEWLAHRADHCLTHHLRQAVVDKLSKVPMGWFTSRASGQVKQAMQDDMGTLHSLTAHFFTSVARAAGAVVISVGYLLALDWRLTLIAMLPFAGFFWFLKHAMKASDQNMTNLAEKMGAINSATVELIGSIGTVKAYTAAGHPHAGYAQAVDGFANAFVDFTRPLVAAMGHAHALIAPVTVLGIVLAAGMAMAHQGWITMVDVLPFVLVAPGLCAPLLLLHTLLHDLQGAQGAAQRLMVLLDTPVLPQMTDAQPQLPQGHGVRFEKVHYAYDGAHTVIHGVSFEMQPGTVTAIVGPSGAGKSTLARLLLRFFDPVEGGITLGGIDLRAMHSTQLYQQIGFVLQDIRLVHASIRENIALGRPDATQAEIEAAAHVAHIHERIVQLPRGYDSVIGEDAQLSGGEAQRLSIARAVLLDPPVLVLDEATAAADAGNEAHIQTALAQFTQHRTVLVIAHRLDTVMHADQILVLDGGTIVEQGTHLQLLDRQGLYARLWDQGGYATTQTAEGLPC
ncbi:ABC transporter ATP-binding protein [Comamonas sp. CMM02]|uniref:ABC transporter ATP-binding protein n=1 Tax=Comamonas sp. CMM02 TaxID=2769307 RepID=UPI0017867E02|nr:ABC transporter ATP-binding protein [Comamonas sp. CMM02]MBD9400275.1 ABC transporter ATP-binding protein [Comamonas sp. CMM02]